ncbi:serine/threonine-protein kinase [Actinophytocola algeriensis]|uniref:non-specific serine/threonine protein kinase n=1 Tax=Actinophytocola algeriensis TaxID=1768010 RepID=A0A7W7VCR9_9PSEU|nr:serine/threonine-protein kinase [Actinophytocola algeriensis]MBB4905324.1 serine/threonine-protein kinase [Actinophytocola algeriensis]MBE1472991.1 serine/threonine-protein kinase [Actinophytocola algeriensis]
MTDVVGPYELAQLIGRGGMGEVWLAHDTRNDREVAIKLLAKQALTDPELQERFRRECKLAGQIRHSHILPVWDFSVEGRPYIVMPFIEDGTDLATILKNGRIEPERAVNIVRQVASALDAAHRKGLRHRDVKPSNIMVEPDGDDEQVLLFDWGIAHPVDTSGAPPVTRLDQLVGTPAYIAPERLGDRVTPDHRADVYSLAVVLFECLAGVKPFDGEDMAILTAQVLRDPPPLPDHLPVALRDVVAKGLAKDPEKRWQSAGEMAAAARAALAPPFTPPSGSASVVAALWPAQNPVRSAAPVPVATQPGGVVPANGPRIATAGLGGAVVALGLLVGGVVDASLFWLLLPLLAAGGGLVGFGLWGPRREPVRPGDPTLDPGGFPKPGP